ncbi:MDR family MFS transporter [Sulfobacillus sp. hq2]|uniref:MDR family MFS transporter n=1 Tax=Sulfobacillus TaxID=28033 RepID=UPI001FA85618|nr:MDR family MFS transporter [Sulfobacillus sp. hq2]
MGSTQPEHVDQPISPLSRRLIVVGLMLAMALAAMDGTIVATAIPTIVHDLGGFSLFPWVFSIYLLVQAVMVPIYGKLADLFGRKPMLMVGSAIFLLGSALSGLSGSMIELIVFRGIQGIGAAAIIPISTTIVGDLFGLQERAKMQGYLSSVWGISAVVGPAIGGFLVEYASWHWIFYINVPIGLAALFMIGRYLHERLAPHAHRIDALGASLLLIGTGALVLGLLEGGVGWPWLSWPSIMVFAVSIVSLGIFYGHEGRTSEPILPIWVFRHRFIALANAGSLVVGVVSMGLSSYLPIFVQSGLGSTPLVAGFALAAMSIGWPVASALSGKLYLRIGFRGTALIGSSVMILASLGFLVLTLHSAPWQVALASLLMGAGLGLNSTSLLVGVQSMVAWNQRGVVTGSNMFTRTLGSTVGVAIFGTLVNAFLLGWLRRAPRAIAHILPPGLNVAALTSGTQTHLNMPQSAVFYVRQGLYGGIHQIFWALLLVSVLAIALEWWLPKTHQPQEIS